jgi:hypothetical protein
MVGIQHGDLRRLGIKSGPSVSEAITVASWSVAGSDFFKFSRTLLTRGFLDFLRLVSHERSPSRVRRQRGHASTLIGRPMPIALEYGGMISNLIKPHHFNDVKNG